MGYDGENAEIGPIILDVETCGLVNAADYLEPVTAARNLVDPIKIAADIAKRTAERDDKLALDWNVGRIVALGWWTAQAGTTVYRCEDESLEKAALLSFWSLAKQRVIVGFNVKAFDLRYLVQRSRLLRIPYPDLDLGKYGRGTIRDLYQDLTFSDGYNDQGAMRRSLKAFAKRFGLPVPDETDGKDVPALIAAGDWEAVEAHCRADVDLTLALARRLGVIAEVAE